MTTHSREFMDLVRAIGDCKSKQEEDTIMVREVINLRNRFSDVQAQGRMRELIIRMMYCEMLGHRVEFGYIHAVNMAQRPALTEKRTGYLAATLFLNSSSELLILLVNTLQRDLKSANHWEACAALSAAGRLIDADTIPAVFKLIKDLIQHKNAHVRKKVLVALHGFLQKSPESVEDYCVDVFKRALCDPDPSVMAAGLNGLFDLAKKDARAYTSVVPSVVVILKQIIEHRLPRDYDYHRVPAPWLQIKLLKLLALLGHANQRASEEMYEVLRQTLQAAEPKTTIGYAIMYECIKTITRIYPQKDLLAAAAENTSRFITSENRNLRYIGIDALSAIVSVNPEFAKEHQMVVIECLEDPDETMRRKTFDLLFGMTNAQNAEFVVTRMTAFLESTRDEFLKRDLVAKITVLAEKFAPSHSWYIQTMNSVFERGGDLVDVAVAHNLMRLIAEGPSGDDEQDNLLRGYACQSYLELLTKTNTPDRLIQVGSWTLGEYAYILRPHTDLEAVIAILCDLLQRSYYKDISTKCYIVSAVSKIVAHNPTGCPGMVRTLISRYCSARDPALQQRCLELNSLLDMPGVMRHVLPVDASCEDVEVDETLPMLNSYVQQALRAGAAPYMSEALRLAAGFRADSSLGATSLQQQGAAGGSSEAGKLRFDAYAKPDIPPSKTSASASVLTASQLTQSHLPPPSDAKAAAANALFAGLNTVGGGAAAGAAAAAAGDSINAAAASATAASGSAQAVGGIGPPGALGLGGAAPKWMTLGHSTQMASPLPGMHGEGGASGAGSSAASEQSLTTAAALPQPTAQELKKKQMAASLFGGPAAPPASSPAPPPASLPYAPAPGSAAAGAGAAHPSPLVDLLSTPTPAPATRTPAAALVRTDDLLGFATQPAAPQQSIYQQNAAQRAGDPQSLDALFSASAASASAVAATPSGPHGLRGELSHGMGYSGGGIGYGGGGSGGGHGGAGSMPPNAAFTASLGDLGLGGTGMGGGGIGQMGQVRQSNVSAGAPATASIFDDLQVTSGAIGIGNGGVGGGAYSGMGRGGRPGEGVMDWQALQAPGRGGPDLLDRGGAVGGKSSDTSDLASLFAGSHAQQLQQQQRVQNQQGFGGMNAINADLAGLNLGVYEEQAHGQQRAHVHQQMQRGEVVWEEVDSQALRSTNPMIRNADLAGLNLAASQPAPRPQPHLTHIASPHNISGGLGGMVHGVGRGRGGPMGNMGGVFGSGSGVGQHVMGAGRGSGGGGEGLFEGVLGSAGTGGGGAGGGAGRGAGAQAGAEGAQTTSAALAPRPAPAPAPPPPAVTYDWTLTAAMLAAVGASHTAQPAVIHSSPATGVETAAMHALVDQEVRLLLQFRESLGASGSGHVVHVRYQIPPHVEVKYLGDPTPLPAGDGTIALPPMPWPRGVTHVLCLTAGGMPAGGEAAMRLRAAVASNGKFDLVEIPQSIVGFQSFLRAATLSEQEFGQQWSQHPCEAKVEVTVAAITSPDAFKSLLEPRINAGVVKIIGAEVISAARHVGHGGVCLVHARVGAAGKVNFIVRTKDAAYTDTMVALLYSRLS